MVKFPLLRSPLPQTNRGFERGAFLIRGGVSTKWCTKWLNQNCTVGTTQCCIKRMHTGGGDHSVAVSKGCTRAVWGPLSGCIKQCVNQRTTLKIMHRVIFRSECPSGNRLPAHSVAQSYHFSVPWLLLPFYDLLWVLPHDILTIQYHYDAHWLTICLSVLESGVLIDPWVCIIQSHSIVGFFQKTFDQAKPIF